MDHSLGGLSLAALLTVTAVWHPNGFAVFVLDAYEGFEVRLHVWLPKTSRLLAWHPPIHSHDRHIASVLLLGEKRDITWTTTSFTGPSIGDDVELEMYKVVRVRAGSELLQPSGQLFQLEMQDQHLYTTGEVFSQRAGIYHEIPPAQTAPFVTLCVKSQVVAPTQAVIDTAGHPPRLVNRDYLTLFERQSIIDMLSEGIGIR